MLKTKNISENYAFIHDITEKVIGGGDILPAEAERVLMLHRQSDIMVLLSHANMLREHFHGKNISLCAIVNARSGKCSEDCSFCAQSAYYTTSIKTYPLLQKKNITDAARKAFCSGVHRFSIVTSGKGMSGKDFDRTCEAVDGIAAIDGLLSCASVGILSKEQFARLRSCGLKRYHHNIETARSHFPKICSTHAFDERIKTIRYAQEEGLEVCCGAILGLGETYQQRFELALTLRELDVDSIPLNFLNPIAGTPLADRPLMEPVEALKSIALFRFVLPDKEIRICGGREVTLRSLQPLMYLAGANGVMVGNYLTTEGRNINTDSKEIEGLGLSITRTR